MKWEKPEFKAVDTTVDLAHYYKCPDGTSGVEYDEDLGTCHNQYWAGNGLTQKAAKENNPYWGGSWGSTP